MQVCIATHFISVKDFTHLMCLRLHIQYESFSNYTPERVVPTHKRQLYPQACKVTHVKCPQLHIWIRSAHVHR